MGSFFMKTARVLAFLLMACLLVAPLVASSGIVEAKKLPTNAYEIYILPSQQELNYYRINKPTFVEAGSTYVNWSHLTPVQKRMSVSDEFTRFEFYIDFGDGNGWTQIALKKDISVKDNNFMKVWRVDFPANYFQPGTYSIRSVCYDWGLLGSPVVYESTMTFLKPTGYS